MKRSEAKYVALYNGIEGLVIQDCGIDCISVTNDAEKVVEDLYELLGPRRLFYFDSMGYFDELLVVGGKFAGFGIGGSPEINAALLEREYGLSR